MLKDESKLPINERIELEIKELYKILGMIFEACNRIE